MLQTVNDRWQKTLQRVDAACSNPVLWVTTGTLGLAVLGLVMVFSATCLYGGGGELNTSYLTKGLIWFALGSAAMWGMERGDYRAWLGRSKPLLIGCFVLMALVAVPGIGAEVNGARRWFRIGGFSFQPSELMKIVVLAYLADFLRRKENVRGEFLKGFVPPLLVLGGAFALLMAQKDLGTSLLLLAIGGIVLWVSGVRTRYLAGFAAAALPILILAVLISPYRRERVMAFFNKDGDHSAKAYHAEQSKLAFGSGGPLGAGIGQGKQKLLFLPVIYSDFILAHIGEELGFVGCMIVFFLFFLLIWGGYRIAQSAPDPGGFLFCFGLLAMLGLQAAMNVAVVTGSVPTKGISLPLVSFGGSSLVVTMGAIGMMLNVARQGRGAGGEPDASVP